MVKKGILQTDLENEITIKISQQKNFRRSNEKPVQYRWFLELAVSKKYSSSTLGLDYAKLKSAYKYARIE